MSDIGGILTPSDRAIVIPTICAPGLALGGLIGALVWQRRRIVGGLIGAVMRFAIWWIGWLWFADAL